jgi:hypothetical protein
MPTNNKRYRTSHLTVPDLDAPGAEAELQKAASELGISVVDLEGILKLGQTMREIIEERGLTPPQVVAATVNLLGDTIARCVEPDAQIDVISDLHQQLLDQAGIRPN